MRVTHKIVYPNGSKLAVAAAIAEHVFPEPVEWYSSIPLTGAAGLKYPRMNPCVGLNCKTDEAPPRLTSVSVVACDAPFVLAFGESKRDTVNVVALEGDRSVKTGVLARESMRVAVKVLVSEADFGDSPIVAVSVVLLDACDADHDDDADDAELCEKEESIVTSETSSLN